MKSKRFAHILEELQEHLPYTVFAAFVGVGALSLISFLAVLTNRQATLPEASRGLFHTFHFSHLFFSSIATTAMFWRHERRFFKTVLVGFFGTILPCGTSDIIFPFMGGKILGVPMKLHICLFQHPWIVLPFIFAGIIIGFALPPVQRSTLFSHAGHVLLSSMATMLYLLSFGVADWLKFIALIFILLILAVMVPCCTSDIIFPLIFTRTGEEQDYRAYHRAV